LGNSPFW